jgi:hypothetical protein
MPIMDIFPVSFFTLASKELPRPIPAHPKAAFVPRIGAGENASVATASVMSANTCVVALMVLIFFVFCSL